MPLSDNQSLRNFLTQLYPNLVIDGTPAASGQRVVYFCHFSNETCSNEEWLKWGDFVLKVSEVNSAQSMAYLQREIEILKNLNSPGYPKLYYNETVSNDPSSDDRLEFMRIITIEEKIHSQPLNEILDQFDKEYKVLDLLIKLIVVLKPLWEWSPPLVHRDLKPQNILITPEGDVVVIDLGIVRIEGADGVTLSAMQIGPCTPKYSSPEQATNDKRNISFKSDLFSLGILCYELLSGSNPFAKEEDFIDEILANVIELIPDSLCSKKVCSESFSLIIEKMMNKKPYKRYRRIDDLIDDLNKIKDSNDY